jgi:hypothetical protein
MGEYCQYGMEKEQNRLVPVDTADDAEGVLVGEKVDAFDDADADETAVAVADDTAVAAVELVGKKVADAVDDKAVVAEGVEREE